MPVAGGGFEPAYNAQAGVDAATMRVVTGEWTLVCLAWNLKRMAKLRPQ